MTTTRRAALALAAGPGLAQEGRPLTLVVPFPAGSVTDNVARALGQQLQDILGQPVVVDNRPGAQGTLAAAHVARSAPDGQVLLVGSSVMFVAGSLIRGLAYDPVASFTPVSGVGATSLMFISRAGSPIADLAGLTARARRPGPPLSIGYGSPTAQVVVALFTAASGTQPTAVAYRGTPQAITDLVAGHLESAVVDMGTGLAQARAGQVRALALSAARRSPMAPEIPVLQEAFPAAELALETIIAVLGPARMPAAAVQRLDAAVQAALQRPAMRERLEGLATTPLPLSHTALEARIRTDNAKWEALIRQAGIEPE